MNESKPESAVSTAAGTAPPRNAGEAGSPASGTAEGARAAEPNVVAAPAPSPLLFGNASQMYPNRPQPAPPPPPPPPPLDDAMPEIVDFDEPPVVVAPMYLPIPVLDHLPPPVARRLTVPPSPLGMPPRVSERPPRPPRRISPLGILAAFGGLVLLAMVGVTTMIATRADPVPIPEPHAAITEPESLTAILDTRTEVPPMETTGDDSEHTAAATARRAHARSAPGTAASRAPAAAAAGRDGTVAAAPSHEQVAMAARTIRGAVLMCGMSMAVTGPGTCELNLTFDSSGHVANVAVAPPYAGTTFGSCAMRAARRMSVPPFSQPTFRATQSFQVR